MGLPRECKMWVFEGDFEEGLGCEVEIGECGIWSFERKNELRDEGNGGGRRRIINKDE